MLPSIREPQPRTVLLTSVRNRGIGIGICQAQISSPKYLPVTLYACSRQRLDLGLSSFNPGTSTKYPELEISSSKKYIRTREGSCFAEERVILTNNAAMVLREHNAENAKRVLDVHYGGTLQVRNYLFNPGI